MKTGPSCYFYKNESGEGIRNLDSNLGKFGTALGTGQQDDQHRDSNFRVRGLAASTVKTTVLITVLIQFLERRRCSKLLKLLARPERFELPTPRFVVWCSIQLSYGRAGQLRPRGGARAAEAIRRI
jgi:hypothetical protein